jgi:hypothetical protein
MKELYLKLAFIIFVFLAVFVIYLFFGRADLPQQGYIEIKGM